VSETDQYTEPLNPVDIESAIQRCSRNIARGVRVVSDAERKARAAEAEYDRAVARAYLEGPAHEKRYAAELATAAERDARDIAQLAFKHADRQARALESELRAYQSIGASVRAMYGAETGVGL
jgi:hypothetical protein